MAVVSKWIYLLLGVLCSAGFPLHAQTLYTGELDQLEFFNGDRLTGKIKKIQRGEITISPDKQDDDAVIKLRDLAFIRARRKLYIIESVQHKRYYGILDKGHAPGFVRVVQAHDTAEVYMLDLDYIENLDNNFWRRLDGNASLGFSYSRSSNIGRLNESHSMTYSTRQWVFGTSGDLMYTMDNDFTGLEKADLDVEAYREFWEKWFIVSIAQFQRSTELGLSARIQAVEAFGPVLIKNRRQDLRVATGISTQREAAVDSAATSSNISAEIPLRVTYYLFRLGTPEIKLEADNTLFFGISEGGRIRSDQNVTLYWKVISHLNLNIQVYANFDSRPPDSGAQKIDFGTVFSVGYSW